MRKFPTATYQSLKELDEKIRTREAEAAMLPPGTARQSILIEVAQLRAYASVKRWVIAAPDRQRGKSHARPKEQA
jgi:hypothetical protein